MNIYSYINSKDVREHLQNIDIILQHGGSVYCLP